MLTLAAAALAEVELDAFRELFYRQAGSRKRAHACLDLPGAIG